MTLNNNESVKVLMKLTLQNDTPWTAMTKPLFCYGKLYLLVFSINHKYPMFRQTGSRRMTELKRRHGTTYQNNVSYPNIK